MDEQFLSTSTLGPQAGVGSLYGPERLARLVLAVQAARQVSQGTGADASLVNSAGPGAGIGPSIDPQQLARLAMTASVLGPTDPFAAGAEWQSLGPAPNLETTNAPRIQKLPYFPSHDPAVMQTLPYFPSHELPVRQNLPYLNPAGKAMVIQNLRELAQANPQQQGPSQPASAITRDYFAGRNSQLADDLKRAAEYVKWRDENFRRANGGGWEGPSGRLYKEEEVRGLYAAQQQEAERTEQRREHERYASALASGTTATITYSDGTRETRRGNHPQRDNNPGNMEAGDFTRGHGAIGKDKVFAIFASAEAGWAAMDAKLRTDEWQKKTVDKAIYDWAPPRNAKGHVINDTVGYQRKVRAALEVTGDTKLSSLTPEQFETLKQTIARIEGFYEDRPNKKVKVNRVQPK